MTAAHLGSINKEIFYTVGELAHLELRLTAKLKDKN